MEMNLRLSPEELQNVVKSVVATKSGLKLLGHLLTEADIFRDGISSDRDMENINRGKAFFGLFILDLVRYNSPESYLKLLKADSDALQSAISKTNKTKK